MKFLKTLTLTGIVSIALQADNFVSLDNENLSRYWGMDKKLLEMSKAANDPDAGFFIDAKSGKIIGQTKTRKQPVYKPSKKVSLKKAVPAKKHIAQPVKPKTYVQPSPVEKSTPKVEQTVRYKGKHILSPMKMEEEVIKLN